MPAEQDALQVRWDRRRGIVNLRGDPAGPGFFDGVSAALGLSLPIDHHCTVADARLRIVPAGPDDWFVMAQTGSEHALAAALVAALGPLHHAVTDVSSGYAVLSLSGSSARDVLAQGCPLDLHPRAFPVGRCAGTHFFKASVWLWRSADDVFDLLVRSSFAGYVQQLLEACTTECGCVQD